MKAASISLLKKELITLPHKNLLEICLRIAKYKKENKELLSYLLFDADDENIYIKEIKDEIHEQFENMNLRHVYLAKKTLRKVLRTANRYIKFSASKKVEVEVLLYFCTLIKESDIPLHSYTVIGNIYHRQIIRINKALTKLHEDLQYDYGKQLKNLI